MTYLMDIIEQGGRDLARAAYWDFGDWGDLWQEFRVGVVEHMENMVA